MLAGIKGQQLPFAPCERITRIPKKSASEVWRLKPIGDGRGGGGVGEGAGGGNSGGGGGGAEERTTEKFHMLMSKLHKEELWTQKMMETTPSLLGEGNR